jgi:hypothetical protein
MKTNIMNSKKLSIFLLIFAVTTGVTVYSQSSQETQIRSATEHIINSVSMSDVNRHTIESRIKPEDIPKDVIGGMSYRGRRIVRHNDHNWFNAVIEDIARYPMEIKLFDPTFAVFRLAMEPTILSVYPQWSAAQHPDENISERSSRFDAKYGYLARTRLILSRDNHPYQVGCNVNLLTNHATALISTYRYIGDTFFNANRPSTASWHNPPIKVKNASFVANFTGGPPDQHMVFAIGNLVGGIGVRMEDVAKRLFVDDLELGEMASRLSLLFDPPPDEVAEADSAMLKVRVNVIDDGWRIEATTPEDGPYQGWWLRLDTTHGEIEVTAPGEAVIKGVPETGAKITVYAISPDAKVWHRTFGDIP